MKSYKDFREECDCDKKEKKVKGKKKGNVEIMPTIDDGKKGMVTKVNNESKNYEGPLYAPWSSVVKGRGFDPLEEKAEVYWSSKALDQLEEIQQKESFEAGVSKARRDYRSGTLLNFKQFMKKLTDILDEWEK
tara:strand:- start:457 stop:855 length:399 start_codon:yes stop_codon:yes gene_type:complete